jgi:hypothetical protein
MAAAAAGDRASGSPSGPGKSRVRGQPSGHALRGWEQVRTEPFGWRAVWRPGSQGLAMVAEAAGWAQSRHKPPRATRALPQQGAATAPPGPWDEASSLRRVGKTQTPALAAHSARRLRRERAREYGESGRAPRGGYRSVSAGSAVRPRSRSRSAVVLLQPGLHDVGRRDRRAPRIAGRTGHGRGRAWGGGCGGGGGWLGCADSS